MSETPLRSWMSGVTRSEPYPERDDPEPGWFDRALIAAWSPIAVRLGPRRARFDAFARAVMRRADALEALEDDALHREVTAIRSRLLTEGLREEAVETAFALIREVSGRRLGLRHFPSQIIGGRVLLAGMIAEMATGEGKTLTSLLPTITMALAGLPAHVITVNPYLARRDLDTLKPVYDAFGLTSALVTEDDKGPERQLAYRADVVHTTNKDVAFDYLRDRVALGARRGRASLLLERCLEPRGRADRLALRGLPFALLDETDSVLVDEARTPLILSEQVEAAEQSKRYRSAVAMARSYREDHHFTLSPSQRRIQLTEFGRNRLEQDMAGLGGLWGNHRAREDLGVQALSALHLYHRDQHYIVADDKVQIVDEYTGRVMPDRSWQHGLHQMVEAKEDVPVTGEKRTIARITYQRFFARYLRLAGMTGTAHEVSSEMRGVYGLPVVTIPTHRPIQRRWLGGRLLPTTAQKWDCVAIRAAQVSRTDRRPVLIGTRSVAASEQLALRLQEEGLDPVVLNARQDAEEARIVAEAGQPGRVTVATNMAGRGTDIKLSPVSRSAGGLHVILTEFHESRRIDRQLFGRSGRQGDPGSYECIVCLEDALFTTYVPRLLRVVQPFSRIAVGRASGALADLLRVAAQQRAEARNRRIRRQTRDQDRQRDRLLAFSGKPE